MSINESTLPGDPGSYFDFLEQGRKLFKAGDMEQAERLFRLALSCNDRRPEVHTELGIIFKLKGNRAWATSAFQTALNLDPEYTPAQDALSELDSAVFDNFVSALIYELIQAAPRNYKNNVLTLEGMAFSMPSQRGVNEFNIPHNKLRMQEFEKWSPLFSELELLYKQLYDTASRATLTKVIAYRLMGDSGVCLPAGREHIKNKIEAARHKGKPTNYQSSLNGKMVALKEYDGSEYGYDLKAVCMGLDVLLQGQYRCPEVNVVPKPGDIVIDAGACWGDGTLHFALDIAEHGHVYAFEFMPHNIEVFNKSLELNPKLKDRISLVPHPVWHASDISMTFSTVGPSSRLINESDQTSATTTTTLSIDDFAESKNLNRIDFIKMDIEGAEMDALRGAIKTIKKDRPKLAICLYHRPSDFVEIPKLIKEAVPDYRFAIRHHSMLQWETVLYASCF